MPESIESEYLRHQPLLEHVSHSLETELRESIDVPMRVAFRVATTEEFLKRAAQLKSDSPLVEVEDQIASVIQVEDANAIRDIERELRESLSVIEANWEGDESELRRLICVIPPQAKPPGWDSNHNLPNTFELLIEATGDIIKEDVPPVSIPIQAESNERRSEGTKEPSAKPFDVFLAHNSKDKPLIQQLAEALVAKGLKPWVDTEQIAPGQSFQDSIQQALQNVESIAICVGTEGLGKWQAWELKAAISKCVDAGIPVVPVLLPEVERLPDSLLFLSELNWVNFETNTQEETQVLRLIWGISGTKPAELGGAESTESGTSVSIAKQAQQGQPGRSSGVIFGLHGIRTHAAWHRTLYEVLGNYAWQVRTERWTFGKFSILKFLSPWARSAKVKWFRQVYIDETKDRRVQLSERDRPSIVAHSFGTYILGNAMLKYDWLRFDKVILCGSILPVDFPWDKLIERGQVNSVRNEHGVNDIWVRLVGWFIPDTGSSGHSGFTCEHQRFDQEKFDFEHSEYFDYGHMEAKWLPFLQTQAEDMAIAEVEVPRPKRTQPVGLYLAYLVILAMLSWGGWRYIRGTADNSGTNATVLEARSTLKEELARRLGGTDSRQMKDVKFSNFQYTLSEELAGDVKIIVDCTASSEGDGPLGVRRFEDVKVNWEIVVHQTSTGKYELVKESLEVREGEDVKNTIREALEAYLASLDIETGEQLDTVTRDTDVGVDPIPSSEPVEANPDKPSYTGVDAVGAWQCTNDKPDSAVIAKPSSQLADAKKSFAEGEVEAILGKGGPTGVFLWAHLHGIHPDRAGSSSYKIAILVRDEANFYFLAAPLLSEKVSGVLDKSERHRHCFGQFHLPAGPSAEALINVIESGRTLVVEIHGERNNAGFFGDVAEGAKNGIRDFLSGGVTPGALLDRLNAGH